MQDLGNPPHEHEHSDDAEMALNQLHRLGDITDMLLDMLNDGEDLPAWVQSKITRAYTDLNDVFGYLEPQSDRHMGLEPPQNVSEAKKKGLWDRMWDRRRAKKRPKRPGEKGYPKTLDI